MCGVAVLEVGVEEGLHPLHSQLGERRDLADRVLVPDLRDGKLMESQVLGLRSAPDGEIRDRIEVSPGSLDEGSQIGERGNVIPESDIDDLIAAYDLALQHLTDQTSGRAYNIGGGSAHSVSLRECIDVLRGLVGHVAVEFSDWRPGDQRVYISDVRRVQQELGWSPSTSFENGLAQLVHWTREQMAAG